MTAALLYLGTGLALAVWDLWDDPEATASDWALDVVLGPAVVAAGVACGAWRALTSAPR